MISSRLTDMSTPTIFVRCVITSPAVRSLNSKMLFIIFAELSSMTFSPSPSSSGVCASAFTMSRTSSSVTAM